MDEKIINIAGAEMELRPISARQYLAARNEADTMAEAIGGDDISKAVLLGAALLSKGLFYNGQRIFRGGDEVLDAFSANEIIDTALFMDIEPEKKAQIMEASDCVRGIAQEMNSAESGNADEEMNKIQHIPGRGQSGGNSSNSGSFDNKAADVSERIYSPRSEMRRVSDFFQRDSRRYDGIISSY